VNAAVLAIVAAGVATYGLRALVLVLPVRLRPDPGDGSFAALGPITLAALAGGQLAGHGEAAGGVTVRLLAVAVAVVVGRRSGGVALATAAAVGAAALADLVG
jgi:hypothetical protein